MSKAKFDKQGDGAGAAGGGMSAAIKWTRTVKDGRTKYEAEAGGARWLISGRRMVGDSRVWYTVLRCKGGRVDYVAGGNYLTACRTLADAKALVCEESEAVTA